MRRPRAVRFYAALRATHHFGGLVDVEFFPVTQHEGLALTLRKAADRLLDGGHHLGLLEPVGGRGGHVRMGVDVHGLERRIVHVERTFPRRKWSRIPFCTIRWKTSGSSAAGRSEYFSASFIIESW